MQRICRCGGLIRQSGTAYWDVLPSCSCLYPVAVQPRTIITTTTTTIRATPTTNQRKESDMTKKLCRVIYINQMNGEPNTHHVLAENMDVIEQYYAEIEAIKPLPMEEL